MKTTEINAIAEKAQLIVCGYAFSEMENNFIHIVNLHAPHHALVMGKDGETIETDMDDIEISIVRMYWNRNKKLVEETYAQVL